MGRPQVVHKHRCPLCARSPWTGATELLAAAAAERPLQGRESDQRQGFRTREFRLDLTLALFCLDHGQEVRKTTLVEAPGNPGGFSNRFCRLEP